MKDKKIWTLEAYIIHNDALREMDNKFQEERDRRYKEVADEKEKALLIKETADRKALELARDIQVYKDEKANELREQINSERLEYVRIHDLKAIQDKYDAILKPILEFIPSHTGREKGIGSALYYMIVIATLAISLAGVLIFR